MGRNHENQPLDRLHPLSEVQVRLGGRSRSSIFRDVEAGRLPNPVRIGHRIYWKASDIDRFLAGLGEE